MNGVAGGGGEPSSSQHLQDPGVVTLPSDGHKRQTSQNPVANFNSSPQQITRNTSEFNLQKTNFIRNRSKIGAFPENPVCPLLEHQCLAEPGSWAPSVAS